jgi:uncharacterized membrane protein YphA (DoxX/SURF4 family)
VTTGRIAAIYTRLALASAFLSAVAARFGFWDHRPDAFQQFVFYTGKVLSFVPPFTIPYFAVAATLAETTLAVLLVGGIRLRWTAAASALLLALFAVSMAISFGIKSPLDASVFSASAAALLLARSSAPPHHKLIAKARTCSSGSAPWREHAPRAAERSNASRTRARSRE